MKKSCFIFFLFLISACKKEKNYVETQVSFDSYTIEDGFQLQALAAEPLLEAPINISFDDKGRLWALEMSGYMRTVEGIDEEAPIGRILILEDRDQDGQMDHNKVFLGNLKLARAFTHVYGGLLYAEPPYLYFTEINSDDTPGKTTVVDSTYIVGGNAEHQPNGLVMGMDNWIYSAKSSKRYRLQNGVWKTSTIVARGQWGITQDHIGRLIYNNNSNQALGDWTFPNVLNQNRAFKPKLGINTTLVKDQRVYPDHVTVVNRGYLPNMLHPDGKLKNFTSACGPLYFEGNSFPNTFQGNLFVCGPEVNLIKRNILDNSSLQISGEQAWEGKEFIRSTDEGFRPVNLQNGPDGAMYIVDMHRGIIQHKTYLTSYLKDLYLNRKLDTVLGMGRILKVGSDENKVHREIDLSKLPPEQWVDSLASKNIWIRNRSQQLMIATRQFQLKSKLIAQLRSSHNEVTRIHALYTLEGLDLLNEKQISFTGLEHYPALSAHILKIMAHGQLQIPLQDMERLLEQKNTLLDYHFAFYLSRTLDESTIWALETLLHRYAGADWFLEPVYAGISEKQNVLLKHLKGFGSIKDQIKKMQAKKNSTAVPIGNSSDGLTQGVQLYRKHCATCHGVDGDGIRGLAPPLSNSEFVSGNTARLASIMLYGLTGPIEVNGKKYDLPAAMPGIGNNPSISDEDIKNIGNYIRNAFTTVPQSLTAKTIDSIRRSKRSLDKMYTLKELNEHY